MLVEQTIEKLHKLNLHSMVEAFRISLENPNMTELSFSERFGLIVDHEFLARENRKRAMRIKRAQLKHSATNEAIDFSYPRGLERSQVAQILDCGWIRSHQNLIITGATGLGKTWLACAFAETACSNGFSSLYKRVPTLLFEMEIAKSNGTFLKLINTLASIDLLLLDDWGLNNLDKQAGHDMLHLIDERAGKHSTIVTSQLSISDWHATIADPLVADAILDRLAHTSVKLALKGDSMRKKQTRKEKSE